MADTFRISGTVVEEATGRPLPNLQVRAYDKDKLRAEIRDDQRLPTWREKCGQLRGLAIFSGYYTREDYAKEADCKEYAIDAYPWQG